MGSVTGSELKSTSQATKEEQVKLNGVAKARR